ncbi:MAG: hypothetical protein ACI94Y_001175 [Maribacter sp.]|jgi:hypothetical protein
MKKWIFIIAIAFSSMNAIGQIGGNNVYEFLNLSQSPRVTGLGGNQITVKDSDVSLAYTNPASLNILMDDQLNFSSEFYFAGTGIIHGYTGYGFHIDKWDLTFHTGMQYITYGTFDARDVFANDLGTFKSSEYALVGGVGKQLSEKLSAGANVKMIISQLESYSSFGMAMDLAGMYADTAKNFTASLVFKNIGTQFSTYAGQREPIPFEIQVGFSKKLRYLPFRVSVIATNLQQWNILYDDPNTVDETLLFGETPKGTSNAQLFVDNFFRHFVFNGEFLFGKKENFQLRVGYSHLRRSELNLEGLRSLAGMSAGMGFKIKQFRFDYGMAFYHVGATAHHIGLSTNFNQFRK